MEIILANKQDCTAVANFKMANMELGRSRILFFESIHQGARVIVALAIVSLHQAPLQFPFIWVPHVETNTVLSRG